MLKSGNSNLQLKSNLYPVYTLENSDSGYFFKKNTEDSPHYLRCGKRSVYPENGWSAKSILILGNGYLNVVLWKHDDGRNGTWFLNAEMELITHKNLLTNTEYKESDYAKLWTLYLKDILQRIWYAITTPGLLKLFLDFTPLETFISDDVVQDVKQIINTFTSTCKFIELSVKDGSDSILTNYYPPIQKANLIESILSLPTDPGAWQDKAILDGCVEIKCPFSGRIIGSSESLLLFVDGFATAYRFESAGEVFFLISTTHPNIKNVYFFPKRNILTHLQVSIYAPVIQQQHLTGFMIDVIKDWALIKAYLLRTDKKQSAASSRETHIGHHIWNELTGLDRMEKNGVLKSIARYYVYETGSEHCGPVDFLFPSLHGKVHRINLLLNLPKYIYEGNYFYVRPGSTFITQNLAQKIINYSLHTLASDMFSDDLQTFSRDSFFVVILFTLRFDNRHWIDQEKGIINIVMRLSEKFSGKIALIIDGHNTNGNGVKFKSHGENILKDRGVDLFEMEYNSAERIKAAVSLNKTTVINTIGCSVCESIRWSLLCDFFVVPWGAGLAKYKWITNSPGLVFSSKEVLTSKADLHIYDDSQYREGVTPCEYLDASKIEDIGEDGFLGGHRKNFNLPINVLYDKMEKMCNQYGRK